eukprot:g632.t1
MTSLASDDGNNNDDTNYVQMTINALTEFRKKLNLTPKHNIVPSDLEPPVWNVEKQLGVIPRTGKEVSKRMNDVSKLSLLPTHYRLFPKHFMSRKPPFISEQNETLCRFLRARSYDVEKAFELYEKAKAIRKDLGADTILTKRDPNEVIWQNGTPHYHYGHDKLGRPFYIELSGRVRVGKLMETQGPLTREDFKHRHVVHMEYMSHRIADAKQRYGSHVSQLTQIMDLQGLTMFGDSRGMTLFRDALEIDQNAYPEYLGNLFIINAPFVFRGMWSVIKGWVDPKTAKKFIVLGSNYKETLLQYIDEDSLPTEYGGTCTKPLPSVNFDAIPKERPEQFDEETFLKMMKEKGIEV